MKADRIDPDKGPTPEQLAAYADGELPDADRGAVADWLRHDPTGAAEVDAHRRFTQLCRDSAAPSPGPEAWSPVRDRIEARLNGPAPQLAGKPWLRRFAVNVAATTLALGGVAAAVLFALSLRDSDPPRPPDVEPFAVVSAEDVLIVSIGGNDTGALVVALPPAGEIGEDDLATQNDFKLLNVEPHADGILADVRIPTEGTPTMVSPPPGWDRDP